MDNFSYAFGYMMERATTMMSYFMLAAFIDKTLEVDRKTVKETIGHEPTQRHLQYYSDLRQEEKNSRDTRQWEIDTARNSDAWCLAKKIVIPNPAKKEPLWRTVLRPNRDTVRHPEAKRTHLPLLRASQNT